MVVVVLLALVAGTAFARAGGAGGFGGSSSGDDLDLFALVWMIFELAALIGPVPTAILVIVGFVAYKILRRQQRRAGTAYYNMADGARNRRGAASGSADAGVTADGGAAAGLARIGADAQDIITKAKSAFLEIQTGWAKQDLAAARRFVSDGVYQRFNTQFLMMRALAQRNVVSRVAVESATIVRADQDGPYHVVDVEIRASMVDQFVYDGNPQLNSGGFERFCEYWSFVRKTGAKKNADLYATNNCPNCAAPLPDNLGERGECPYCASVVNSGEFDWVLSKITQADDYGATRAIERSGRLRQGADALRAKLPDFSVLLLEDKVANGYLQILTAVTTGEAAGMRRFVADGLFTKLVAAANPAEDAGIRVAAGGREKAVYDRLFLNRVTLIGIRETADDFELAHEVVVTSRRVRRNDSGRINVIDHSVRTDTRIVLMRRSKTPRDSVGNLYMHTCAACGAPIQNSLDPTCPYCSVPYNNTQHDWVLSDILERSQYGDYYRTNRSTMAAKITPVNFDNLYDVKDFALNNLMVIIAADGRFDAEERRLAEDLARRFGHAVDRIQPMFDLAAAGRLGIRMPHDVTKRKKVFALMTKAALADGAVSQEEKDILDYIERTYVLTTSITDAR